MLVFGLEIAGLLGLFARNASVQSPRPESAGLTRQDERPVQVRPKAIRKGQSATLLWFMPTTHEVRLEEVVEDDGPRFRQCLRLVGVFPSKGSLQVWPHSNTTYVVSCADAGTICAESISITVR